MNDNDRELAKMLHETHIEPPLDLDTDPGGDEHTYLRGHEDGRRAASIEHRLIELAIGLILGCIVGWTLAWRWLHVHA